MDCFDFTVGDCDELERFLADRIYEFNAQATSCADGESFAAVQRDFSGAVVAGVSGYTWCGCCYVSHLWVAEFLRGRGIGRALLDCAENHAKQRGCTIVLLSSHSFQAPGFYERLGYLCQATVADHPVGHASVVLAKRLGPPSSDQTRRR